jgi:hypothetical protein
MNVGARGWGRPSPVRASVQQEQYFELLEALQSIA